MKDSKIEWTDHTHNEWIGCEKISDGCKHCYAEELMDKRYAKAKWGANGTRTLTSIQNQNKPFSWNRKAEKEGVRYKVFAQNLSDTFEDREELEPWRIELFEKIASTPNLDWLVLTKRPEVANKFFQKYPQFEDLSNLWLGVSVENQQAADERIPILLDLPAKVRFLSCEPLLGFINFDEWFACWNEYNGESSPWLPGKYKEEIGIDWVIVGGESGKNARPMHPDWVRSIRDQCQEAGVPFFFKQWGEWAEGSHSSIGERRAVLNNGESCFFEKVNCENLEKKLSGWGQFKPVLMKKVGKKKAGSMLDGREWKEFPR